MGNTQMALGSESEAAIPHRNLAAQLNGDIVGSEIEGGVYLSDLAIGARLDVETERHLYSVVNSGRGKAWISGHPGYCPQPIEVMVAGSTWGGSLLKPSCIGRGMRLEFWHPSHDLVTTSRIRDIRQVNCG